MLLFVAAGFGFAGQQAWQNRSELHELLGSGPCFMRSHGCSSSAASSCSGSHSACSQGGSGGCQSAGEEAVAALNEDATLSALSPDNVQTAL